jgi:hypothetical protein
VHSGVLEFVLKRQGQWGTCVWSLGCVGTGGRQHSGGGGVCYADFGFCCLNSGVAFGDVGVCLDGWIQFHYC